MRAKIITSIKKYSHLNGVEFNTQSPAHAHTAARYRFGISPYLFNKHKRSGKISISVTL